MHPVTPSHVRIGAQGEATTAAYLGERREVSAGLEIVVGEFRDDEREARLFLLFFDGKLDSRVV